MSIRTVSIKQGYNLDGQKLFQREYKKNKYVVQYSNDETVNLNNIYKVLSPEIDIFSELPNYVYKNTHVKDFLNEMKLSLLEIDRSVLDNVTLSKLCLTEYSDMTIVIEWIFNYFRIYFSFDSNEGDYYGEVKSDVENGRFHNTFNRMDVSDYHVVAKEEINYAVKMAGGEYK